MYGYASCVWRSASALVQGVATRPMSRAWRVSLATFGVALIAFLDTFAVLWAQPPLLTQTPYSATEQAAGTIRPLQGRVVLTDYSSTYPDASNHNALLAHLQLDSETRARVMTFNIRRAANEVPGHTWLDRRHRVAKLIADWQPSVVAVQECDSTMYEYLLRKLRELTGAEWAIVRHPNVGVLYKVGRWEQVAVRKLDMDNSDQSDRRFVAVLLRNRATGAKVWFGSTHLSTVSPWWRRYQAREIVALLKTLPNNGIRRTVMTGDLNDYAHHDSTGVRQVFAGAGFYELRVRLSDAQMVGDSLRTHHQFDRLTPRDSRQIDAILTAR
jgi:endonuclease/exonuclease/phosphatase family metal-dependent hydrolase